MIATTGLITVAEFEKIPNSQICSELRHGEVVIVPPPRMQHNRTEKRIVQALEKRIGHRGYVNNEVSFRPLPEYEVWTGDVVFLAESRNKNTPANGWITGAPDLVVEVLAPTNTAEEIQDREDICLSNGSRQFWTVSTERRTVKVTTADGKTGIRRPGDDIDLTEFGDGKLPVVEIFSDKPL